MKCPACGSEDVIRRPGYQSGAARSPLFGGGAVSLGSHCYRCQTHDDVVYICNQCTAFLCWSCATPPDPVVPPKEPVNPTIAKAIGFYLLAILAFIGVSLAYIGLFKVGLFHSLFRSLNDHMVGCIFAFFVLGGIPAILIAPPWLHAQRITAALRDRRAKATKPNP